MAENYNIDVKKARADVDAWLATDGGRSELIFELAERRAEVQRLEAMVKQLDDTNITLRARLQDQTMGIFVHDESALPLRKLTSYQQAAIVKEAVSGHYIWNEPEAEALTALVQGGWLVQHEDPTDNMPYYELSEAARAKIGQPK